MFFFRYRLIGILLMAVAVGMFLIIILPKGSVGVILAAIIFLIGLYFFKRCYY